VDKIVIPVVSVVIGIIGLFLGVILGSLLGKAGSLEVVRFISRLPIILIRSPKKLKSKWKMWQELRGLRKIECLKKQNEVKGLKGEIGGHKKEIKKIKAQIRRVKWELKQPK